jgi:RsiW-degrading membrane proteinase PrsW (M82 family)
MGLLVSIFLGFTCALIFALIIYWIDRYEKEPLLLLGGVFTWGAVVAAGTAFLVNTILGLGVYFFTSSEGATELTTGSIIAPIVEETLKGMAVLLVFLFFYKEFDSILDGIIYASITALGFAATENSYYIYSYGFATDGWSGLWYLAFVRIILVGWQHPFFTSFIGIGLAVARLNRNVVIKLAAPVAGWFLAVSAHAMHNTLASLLSGWGGLIVGSFIDWGGWLLMFLFILWAISRERNWIINQLREEVSMGTITARQYNTACSAWQQGISMLKVLLSRRMMPTINFYQKCAEISYKKEQRSQLGEEGSNSQIIEKLRRELALLSPTV